MIASSVGVTSAATTGGRNNAVIADGYARTTLVSRPPAFEKPAASAAATTATMLATPTATTSVASSWR